MASEGADVRWMGLALSLGRRTMGQTWPNPAVGCVIVRDGTLIGRGWTKQGGRPHAETEALAQAGARARGATVYVTLEPCAHQGQTPPCAIALIKAGVARVVSAMGDPDTRVKGRGYALLRDAGIEVQTGCLGREAQLDHRGFTRKIIDQRPLVTLKLASSLDGRIATETGESRWITGSDARRYVHHLRARHDAVMVGSGTALADNPTLNVRGFGPVPQPVRVICDSHLRTPPDSTLAMTAHEQPLWICHTPTPEPQRLNALEKAGAILVCCNELEGRLDLQDVLKSLADRGLTRVFCEGGGRIAASLLEADLVDDLVIFNAGVALGATGTASVAPLTPRPLADFTRFDLRDITPIGADTMSVWQRK